MTGLTKISVEGYRSIRSLKNFELGPINVLIGPNGGGKSNFISVFSLLSALANRRLNRFVGGCGGPDALLHGSRKKTTQIVIAVDFDTTSHLISFRALGDQLSIQYEDEWIGVLPNLRERFVEAVQSDQEAESDDNDPGPSRLRLQLRAWRVYHFHDTGLDAGMRNKQETRDNLRLKTDAANLAPFLRMLREKHIEHFDRIVDAVRMVAPFLSDFVYRPEADERIDLEWFDTNDSETPRGPRQLSDGTLRFIALATVLLQPPEFQPDMIVIDEPELGLHPYAISVLATLIRRASESKQVIVSTQSVELVNEFEAKDIIVAALKDGESVFERLDQQALGDWLNDYALGELWKMNVIGGRPTR